MIVLCEFVQEFSAHRKNRLQHDVADDFFIAKQPEAPAEDKLSFILHFIYLVLILDICPSPGQPG